jgi:CheY-like chemotaxis protein|tara:strand:- start:54 stop:248 length:195 start_codon:yes stop_codon:yes gene_type:complete
MVMEMIIRNMGSPGTDCAPGAESGVAVALDLQPDIILMDINLPVIGGVAQDGVEALLVRFERRG